MKEAILFLVMLLFVVPVVQGDEIRAHVDANGNVTYKNSGPTIQEQQQREVEREKREQEIEAEKSNAIATEIAVRHKELISDPNLSEALFNTAKKYAMQGNSPSNSLLLAEDEMISLGYLRDEVAIRAEEERKANMEKRRIAAQEEDERREAKREDEEERRHGHIVNQPGGGMKMDTNGTFYMDAGGGNMTSTKDGTFMQKAAGGYIDTKTGQFVPSN
jgi:hypothetical protein